MNYQNVVDTSTIPDEEFGLRWVVGPYSNLKFEELFRSQHEDFFLGTPWAVLSLTAFYLYFVLVFGPTFMKSKKPMALKKTLLAYNAAQVVFSFWWVYRSLTAIMAYGVRPTLVVAGGCQTPPPEYQSTVSEMGYWYLMSKLVELLDTIFFILRGKQSQVTFLHVYHHTNMAISTWFFIKNDLGAQSMILGLCNTFVHIVMYSYYLLAGLGPEVRRYLWWKKYITALQITQFLIILAYLIGLGLYACAVPSAFVTFSVVNTTSFLVLFLHFYTKNYRSKKRIPDVCFPSKDKPSVNGNSHRGKEIKSE